MSAAEQLEVSGSPTNNGSRETSSRSRVLTPSEFARAYAQTCGKCRQRKPLVEFGEIFHTNRHTGRGHQVFHGWREVCLGCEARHGQ